MASSSGKKVQTYDVFVGNLPLDADEKSVGKLFTKFGETKSIFVKDANCTPKKRFAFVNFMCEPDAEQAIKEMHDFVISGNKLIVRRQELRKKGPYKRENEDNLRAAPSNNDPAPVSFGGRGPSGEKEMALVTYVENPVTVWLQTLTEENLAQMTNISEQLAACCPAAPKVKGTPQIGKVYAAMFSEDGEWYRCIVKHLFGSETLKVQYIDYGNTEEIHADQLLEIPPTVAAHKPLAYKIVLHNTKAKDVTDQNGIRFLRKQTENRQLLTCKTRPLQDGTGFYGYLSFEGDPVNINDKVVNEGFASKRPSMGMVRGGGGESVSPARSLTSVSTGSNIGNGDISNVGSNTSLNSYMTNESGYGNHNRSANTSPMKANQTVKKSQYPGKSPQGMNMPPSFSVPPPLMNTNFTSPNAAMNHFYNKGSPADNSTSQQRAEEIARHLEIQKTLQSDVNKKKREIDKLRTDLARKELELQQVSASKVQVRSVVDLAKKVKNLRLQFPTGRASGLDEAIELALSSERVTNSSVTTLQHVITAVSTYRALQKEICNAKDIGELDSLVETRDLARKNLYDKLTECVQELEVMPLDVRHECVTKAEAKVTSNYKAFMHISVHGCPSLEDLIHGFRDWKKKKEAEFCHVRENTNICQREVTKALHQLEGVLDLEADEYDENVNLEINTLLKTYMQALQQEIAITDMERSQDSSLVATVLTAILNELHGEIGVLDNCRQFMAEFSQMKAGIEPWLDTKPNFDDIQECRKNIRSLKSKLRHMEADRLDLEESGDNEEEKVLKTEIEGLQYQLHQALVNHDQLVVELAKVSDSHFPELLIKHQDTGIRTYLNYNGIVKTGWEVEHFTLSPAVRPGMYSSTFCGDPVYVQEYHVGDSEHLRKEDFLAQIMAYCSISSDSDCLGAIQAVFFTKNERIGYVVISVEQMQDLETFMNEPGFDDKRRQKIARGVTSALNTLHQHGFVHGEVNPQNVGVKLDGSAVLLCPDFSRSLFDRTKRGYMTSHGMMFQAPEISNAHQSAPVQITAKTDLYLLGLLILYLHHPRSVIPASRDGTPNLAVLSLDPETGSLLYNLLCGKPEMRLAAGHILKSGYLTRTMKDHSLSPALDTSHELVQESYGQSQEIADGGQLPMPDTPLEASVESNSGFTSDGLEQEKITSLNETEDQSHGASTLTSNADLVREESPEVQILSEEVYIETREVSDDGSQMLEELTVKTESVLISEEKLSPLTQNQCNVDSISQYPEMDETTRQTVDIDSLVYPEPSHKEPASNPVGLVDEESESYTTSQTASLEQKAVQHDDISAASHGHSGVPLHSPRPGSEVPTTDRNDALSKSSLTEGLMTPEKYKTNVDI
ncbi:serine/threonine-protein kinase 31-like isoform X2 [Saccostrea echinata]|uniref:serine/threonine-protein kinase 31-like isoform X2 n=1 Tax=Saccostrea echinata TaxID=191078 RepID=UPI002A7F0BF3|nr:serine/threonine-protein kinase 31-like isoform X2 [Saccostrea echinata]